MKDTGIRAVAAQDARNAAGGILITPPAPPSPQISEAMFQALILDIAGWLGWTHYHTRDSRGSNPGWPDLVLVRERAGMPARILFREIKTSRGRLTQEQARWGQLLLNAGLDW